VVDQHKACRPAFASCTLLMKPLSVGMTGKSKSNDTISPISHTKFKLLSVIVETDLLRTML
jgi:hypothetical protein